MTNLELIHHTVAHYLKYVFRPIKIEGEKKVTYMLTNALRISLGKRFDHTEYCIWLADNAPNYGVIVHNYAFLKFLKAQKRDGKWKHSKISKQVQLSVLKLSADTQVLVILNASQYSLLKLKKILRSWSTTKPVLFIG